MTILCGDKVSPLFFYQFSSVVRRCTSRRAFTRAYSREEALNSEEVGSEALSSSF